MSKHLIGTKVTIEIKREVEKMAEIKGISVSEYLRSLLLEDLDKRTIFTDQFKEGRP